MFPYLALEIFEYLVLFVIIVVYRAMKRMNTKKKLVYTARVKRLLATELILTAAVFALVCGFGGMKRIPECLDKVQVIRKMINDKGLSTDLEVDGGINLDNVAFAMEKGANVIVAGSAVFKDDIAANAKAFLNRLQ